MRFPSALFPRKLRYAPPLPLFDPRPEFGVSVAVCTGDDTVEVGSREWNAVEVGPQYLWDVGRARREGRRCVFTIKIALALSQVCELFEKKGGRVVGRDGGEEGQSTGQGLLLGRCQHTARRNEVTNYKDSATKLAGQDKTILWL